MIFNNLKVTFFIRIKNIKGKINNNINNKTDTALIFK